MQDTWTAGSVFGNFTNHLERKLLKYWQKHVQHRENDMFQKGDSYLYLWKILSQSNLILQCNHPQRKLLMYGQKHTRHWQSDKFQKEKIVPWKPLRFQSRSAKVLNSCCMHTTGTEILVWKVICTIVKGSCQSIDKNMCKVDITNYFDSVKFCLSKPRKCYEKSFLFCFLK